MSAKTHYDDLFGRKLPDITSAVAEIDCAHENVMQLLRAIVDNCMDARGSDDLNYTLARSAMAYLAEVADDFEEVSEYVAQVYFKERADTAAAEAGTERVSFGGIREARLASQDAANARRGVPAGANA